ncbi:MAG: TolC family protein [Desulfobacteraceae bacterium]|nr:TolC family protein [Desulfobacteraceae bacterium]
MKTRLSITIICFLSIFSSGPLNVSWGEEGKKLSLNEVLKVAFERNPTIAASRFQVDALDAMVTQVTSAYYPQLSNMTNVYRVGGGLPDALGGAIGRGGAGGIDLESPFNLYNTNFFVSQYLYDFGRTPGKVEQSRRSLSATQKDLQGTIADVARDVKQTYFEVLKKQRLVKVEEEPLEIHNKHLNQARALHKAGLRPKIDVTKSLVDRAKTKLKLIKARFAVRTAKIDLENVLGGPPLPGKYALATISSSPPEPTDMDSLILQAIKLRPEIASLNDQIKSAEAQIRVAKSGYWPSVSANGGYGLLNTKFPLKDYWLGGVSLKWEIFSGFETQGKQREARARCEGLKAKLKKLELAVVREVSRACIGVLETSETIETAKVVLDEAKENMGLADGRYRAGLSDSIEFADAELTLTSAKSDLVQATYQYFQSYANLERAVGGLKSLAQTSTDHKASGLNVVAKAYKKD